MEQILKEIENKKKEQENELEDLFKTFPLTKKSPTNFKSYFEGYIEGLNFAKELIEKSKLRLSHTLRDILRVLTSQKS